AATTGIPNPIPPSDLTKVDTGRVELIGFNTYTGNTFVNTGILDLRSPHALGFNTSAVQLVSTFGTNLQYQLVYNGTPTSTLTLSSTAAQVKAALDAVVQLSDGSNFVTVTQLGASYNVYFNGGALANVPQP